MRKLLKSLWFAVFPYHPLYYIGVIVPLFVPRTSKARIGDNLLSPSRSRFDKFVRLAARTAFYGNFDRRPEEHKRAVTRQMWAGPSATAWHDHHRRDFMRVHAADMAKTWEAIEKVRAARPGLRRVCELGCGHGQALRWIREQARGADLALVGVDINAQTIETNRVLDEGCGITFESADFLEWTRTNETRGTIFLFRYTLTFLTETQIRELFTGIRSKGTSAICLAEMLYRSPSAHSQGCACNTKHTHNYPLLLEQAGFTVVSEDTLNDDPEDAMHRHVFVAALSAI